eukprot:952968-Alexandrium_andersonii.AAC.1
MQRQSWLRPPCLRTSRARSDASTGKMSARALPTHVIYARSIAAKTTLAFLIALSLRHSLP